jgi:DNA-binding response OmpR family regulator
VHVLIVEDDPTVAEAATHGLARFGFTVTAVGTGTEALDSANYGAADIVILDLGLPDLDGYEVCRRLRAASDVPIIVLTGRGEEMDRVMGLELGADDYVVKPVGFHELVARIRAINRRVASSPSGSNDETGPAIWTEPSTGGESHRSDPPSRVMIDRPTRRVSVDGEAIIVTAKEFDLLALLAANPDVVLRRADLIKAVWGADYFGSTKTLDTHVSTLRRKLGEPLWIESVRGVGFRWVPPT